MKEKIYWTQKNGTKVDIDEMDINHLRNTLKMIVRQMQSVKISGHNGEFELHGDMANEFNNGYIEDEDDDDWESHMDSYLMRDIFRNS